jgi:hypothetical protein
MNQKELIDLLERIKRNDLTPPYTYTPSSRNREGTSPNRGSRFMTPYEMADAELREIKHDST